MSTMYLDSGGNAAFSGTSDSNTADLSGTNATWAGTTTVTLDGSPSLAGVATSGANQAAIYLTNATNSNKKIFWITGIDNVGKTVTVDVAPTGTSGSVWNIGGRQIAPNTVVNVLRAGDTAIVNNSISSGTTTYSVFRASGTSAAGFIKIIGKTGVRPVLTIAANAPIFDCGGLAAHWIENLELQSQGSNQNTVSNIGPGSILLNVKISDGGGAGIVFSAGGNNPARIVNCEVSGIDSSAISGGTSLCVIGCYIHDTNSDGITISGASIYQNIVLMNIIDTCTGRGIYLSGAPTNYNNGPNVIIGNTIYGCNNSGLELADIDHVVLLLNNIFLDNGDAATEYNVKCTGSFNLTNIGKHNCFNAGGARGGDNLSNYTADATDIITAPAFTNAAGGDFTLAAGSPCLNTGTPIGLLT